MIGKSDMNRFQTFKRFPRLETNRLILREITIADAEWYLDHFSRKEIVEGQGFPAPKGMKEARKELQIHFVDLFKNRNGFRWGIEKKGEESLIGSCGYYKWLKPDGRQAEIGYDLDPPYWGQGIMTEALTAITDFGFQKMKLNRIELLVMPRNERSSGLASKLGFKKEGVLREHGFDEKMQPADDVIFSMLRSDWIKMRRPVMRTVGPRR
jgi:ribosomal-protein-alanine N-acetyltransferase